MSLIASIAPRQPTVPDTAPITGKRRFQSSGCSGYRQRRQPVLPGAKLVIVPQAGHLSAMERPAWVANVVDGFLKTL